MFSNLKGQVPGEYEPCPCGPNALLAGPRQEARQHQRAVVYHRGFDRLRGARTGLHGTGPISAACLALPSASGLGEDFCAGNHRLLHELPDLPRPLRRLGASVSRACACESMHGGLPSRCSSAIATVAPLRSRRSRSGCDSIVMGTIGHFRCCCCSFELVTVRIADLACMPPSPVAFPGAFNQMFRPSV